jgi:uncharacterized lipoprotein YmbA
MKSSTAFLRFVTLVAFAALPGGCLFKTNMVPTRHFVLAPVSAPAPRGSGEEPFAVGIGFVKMPRYILGDSVVLRKSPNEIVYLEDALWAERLDHCFERTLAANLSAQLPSGRVFLEWRPDQVSVRLSVDVQQFDVDTQGQGTLVLSWRITAPTSEQVLKAGDSRFVRSGPSPYHKPQAVAATLSALTGEFSHELAQELRQAARDPALTSAQSTRR